MKADETRPLSDHVVYKRFFALATLLFLGFLIYLIIVPFLPAFAWAFIIAFLLYPLYVRLVVLMKGRRTISALAVTALTLIFLLGPLTLMMGVFLLQASDLLQSAQGIDGSVPKQVMSTILHSPITLWIQTTLDLEEEKIIGWINEGSSSILGFLVSASGGFVLSALNTVTTFSITIFILFFFLRDGTTLLNTGKNLVPLSDSRKKSLTNHLSDVMRAVIFGMVFTAAIQGALTGVALAVLNIPASVVLGVIAALLALLPVGGTALVWGPVCIILAMNDRWVAAIGLALWGTLLVGTIDNVLRPILVSRSSQSSVSTLTVFIGVIGGALAFGMVGLFLGPVILALVIALLRFVREKQFVNNNEA